MLQPQDAGPRRLPSWAESPWSVRGQMFRLSRALWEAGATPGAVVRTLGPWGPGLIQKYARSRCEQQPQHSNLRLVHVDQGDQGSRRLLQ